MKNLTLLGIVTLTMLGCATPVTQRFPDIPADLKEKCANLEMIPDGTDKLSSILENVTKNYSQYHECKAKNDLWLEWYKTQKKIYEIHNK